MTFILWVYVFGRINRTVNETQAIIFLVCTTYSVAFDICFMIGWLK